MRRSISTAAFGPIIAAAIASCSGDQVLSLEVDPAAHQSVLWLFAGDRGIERVVAADPGAPLPVRFEENARVYALLYPFTIADLQLSGEVPLPPLDRPHRDLPAPALAYQLVELDRFEVMDPSRLPLELRLPPLDAIACAEEERCFDESALLCTEVCGADQILAPDLPLPPRSPRPLDPAGECPREWTPVAPAGIARCRPDSIAPTVPCPSGQYQAYAAAQCAPLGDCAPLDPNARAIWVEPGRAGGTGTFLDPYGALEPALIDARAQAWPVFVQPGALAAAVAIEQVTVRGACSSTTRLTGSIVLGEGAVLANLSADQLIVRGRADLHEVFAGAADVSPAIFVEAAGTLRAERVAVRGRNGARVYGAIELIEGSVEAAQTGIKLCLSARTSTVTRTRVASPAGARGIYARAASVNLGEVEVTGFTQSIIADAPETVVTADNVRVEMAASPAIDGELCDPFVAEHPILTSGFFAIDRARLELERASAVGQGSGLELRAGSSSRTSLAWLESRESFLLEVATATIAASHISAGAMLGPDSSLRLEDLTVAGPGALTTAPAAVLRGERLAFEAGASIQANRDANISLKDIFGRAPAIQVFAGGTLVLERAEVAQAEVPLVTIEGTARIEDLQVAEGRAPAIELKDPGVLQLARAKIDGPALLAGTFSAPGVRVEDLQVSGSFTEAALDLLAGKMFLDRVLIEGATYALALQSTTATITSLTIRSSDGKAINAARTPSVYFDRTEIIEVARNLSYPAAVRLDRNARARFSNFSIENSGSPEVPCVELLPSSSSRFELFEFSGCPRGLSVRPGPEDQLEFQLSAGELRLNGTAIEVPSDVDPARYMRRVRYRENEADIFFP